MSNQPKQRYKLIAQHKNDKVIIEPPDGSLPITKSACEILADKKMLQEFLPQDIAIIGVIAGMTVAENNSSDK